MTSPPFTQLIPRLSPCHIPAIGIGTYQLYGESCVQSVCDGIRAGFRLIDTAASYKNEELVGEGIQKSEISRAELFVVVKILLKAMHSKEEVRKSILGSIQKLRIHYADCVIMHWPGCHGVKPEDHEGNAAARRRCWEVMMELQKEGLIRYLGVSNFLPRHFAEINTILTNPKAEEGGEDKSGSFVVNPVLNQIELHPLCVQEDVLAYCQTHGMVPQQYAPLGENSELLLRHPKLLELWESYFPQHTIHDMLIMWGLAQGFCVLIKSTSEDHHRANFQAAIDYFASVKYQTKGCEEQSENNHGKKPGTPESQSSVVPLTSRLLDHKQLEVIRNLRDLMNVKEDTHLCWYSQHIA